MRATGAPSPEHFPQPRRRRALGRPENWVWPVLGVALVVGSALMLLAPRPWAAAGSYAGAMVLVVACFGISTVNLRMSAKISPGTMFVAAIFSYGFTVAVLSFAWLLSSPRVVVGAAVFAGAAVAVLVWVAGVVRAAWVR